MDITTPQHPNRNRSRPRNWKLCVSPDRRSARNRRVAAVAIVAAVLGATAACTGSSSGSSNTGSTSSAQTTVTPSATASATAAASGAATTQGANTSTGSATSTTTSSAASAHAVTGASACTGTEIKVAQGRNSAAMGHHGDVLVFTNSSSRTCTLQGYPGAAIMSGSTVLLNATRALNGYIGDERQLSSAPLVTLAPGAVASAMLEWDVDNGQTCVAGGSGTLQITPPNTTVTTGLGSMTVGSEGVCSGFDIHPVVAGDLGD